MREMATMMIVAGFDSQVRDSRWRRAV